MSSKTVREYRLTEEEASKLDTWHIINTLGIEFEQDTVEKDLDFEKFYRDHRDCFVISKADAAS